MIHGDDILVTTNIGGSQVAVAAPPASTPPLC